MVGTLVSGSRCAMSWCDLDLTFELAVVTLTLADARWFTVQYALVSSTCKTTRRKMTLAVERDIKQQLNP